MIDAIGEPHSFEINLERLSFGVISLCFCGVIDHLQNLSYDKTIFAKLVESDVSSVECGFGEAENVAFLFQTKFFKSSQTVSEHLNICKSFASIFKC